MPTERVIDLEHQRYADREYMLPLVPSVAAAEQAGRDRREQALARLRKRVRERPGEAGGSLWLDRTDLLDLLLVLGEADW
jgi:hypothetical protein